MLGMLRKIGLSSNLMYGAGFASIGLSVAAWVTSRNAESAGIDRADRWGIFIGQWAPTFFALGVGLRMDEQWGGRSLLEDAEEMKDRARDAMPTGAR